VALTFDDGYRDNLTLAVPTLQRLGIPATVFLVPGILDGAVDPWWERLAWALSRATAERVRFEDLDLDLSSREKRVTAVESVEAVLRSRSEAARTAAVAELVAMLAPEGSYRADELFMRWDEAKALLARGIEVGSHTMRHAIMAREDATSQLEDLRESKERLEAGLQTPITSLAYPNGQRGDYDAVTKTGASDAGFECAVTTWGVSNHRCMDPLEARRRIIAPGDNVLRVLGGLVRGTWRERERN
jgi:peptidoglycan/xylan/chitin deacetylase (PgdA/CDA1 family)